MENDASQEERRNAKRAKRDANAILEGQKNKPEGTETPSTPTPSTPMGEKAPNVEKKGMSKKEAKKTVDAKVSEAQQHQQSVETARRATSGIMTGRLFGAKKSYSWLNKATSSGFSSPSRPGAAAANVDKGARGGETAVIPKKRIGDWREDREKGAGIQVRDVLFTLELDGRGARHIQKAYAKDPKEDRMG